MNKPTLTPEQSRAIELAKMFALNIPVVIENVSKGKPFGNSKYAPLESLDIYTIMSALVNGYEIEKSPEDRVREYYDSYGGSPNDLERKCAILTTLNLLGITIEGINAD